jgi:hypothetical protein
MPFVEKNGKLYAVCDHCGYRCRYPRKDKPDVPKWWGGDDKHGLECMPCYEHHTDAESELDAARNDY